MKRITVLTFMALSSVALAKSHNSIHVQHHGKIANIPSHAPVMTRQAAATRNAIRVRPLNLNQRGAARIKGTIRGLGMASYRFHGQAGQQVRISPIGNNYSMEFGLFDHNRGMNFGTTHILPTTGEYEVRIVQTRKNAARNRKHYRYDANVQLGNVGSVPVSQARSSRPQRVNASARRQNVTDNYDIGTNTTADGSRRVVSTSTPINGERTGKISALPRGHSSAPVVRENVITSHINYHDDPVVSHLKSDKKSGKKQKKTARKGKGVTTNYHCQSGGNLQVVRNGSDVTVKNKNLTLNLQKNTVQSQGANQIYTGNGGFLHLVNSKKSANPEVLSFEYKGKTLAFGCK